MARQLCVARSLARDGWLSELTRLQQHQQQQTTRHGAETLCAHADKNAILGTGVLALKTAAQRGMKAVVKCLTCQLTFRVLIPATTWRDHGVLVQKKEKKKKKRIHAHKKSRPSVISVIPVIPSPRLISSAPDKLGRASPTPYIRSSPKPPLPRLSSRARPPSDPVNVTMAFWGARSSRS